MSQQKAVVITTKPKGIASVRAKQRALIKFGNMNEVLLRVPVEEVTDEAFNASEDTPLSMPKYHAEMATRHYEHYNVKPLGGKEGKYSGLWCETIVTKDEAEAIVAAHPQDTKIVDEAEDNIV